VTDLRAFWRNRWTIRLRTPAALALALPAAWALMIRMPGESYEGPLPPLDARQKALEAELARDVAHLARDVGERNLAQPGGLDRAARFVEDELRRAGYAPARQEFEAAGHACANVEAELRGSSRPHEIVVVGAHYDSALGCPAADDNGSGAAAVLALARAFGGAPEERTIRFVEFANEEPPSFQRADMGSLHYARRARERGEQIVAMLSLETIGYYSDAPGSQSYPPPFGLIYPTRGDFIAFVGNTSSRALVRQAIGSFRAHAQFPSEGTAVPGLIPGVGWSDHWAFWQAGYAAVMITDTAPFRYPFYHTGMDTPDRLDFDRMARVVAGVTDVVRDLARAH
jgi:hypothetical protein